MNKPRIPDAEESRAGYRSGEGVDSVLRHLMAADRRRQKRKSEEPDSRLPGPSPEDGDGAADVPLPP